MTIKMTHPESGGTYDAQPSQVPHLQEAGWQVVEGQQEQGEVWPAEVQRFEGQPPIRMRHPDLGENQVITVAESAVPHHAERGWLVVDEEAEVEPEAQPAAGFEGLTVEELREEARARGIAVSGTKAELLGRLADSDQQQETQAPAEAGPSSEEA